MLNRLDNYYYFSNKCYISELVMLSRQWQLLHIHINMGVAFIKFEAMEQTNM